MDFDGLEVAELKGLGPSRLEAYGDFMSEPVTLQVRLQGTS